VSSYDLDGSSTTKEGVEKVGIRQIIREEIRQYLQDPLGFPEEYKGWLPEWITQAGIDVPIGQVIGFNQVVNKLVDVDVLMTAIAHTNWNGIAISSVWALNATKQSSGAQNDEINFDVSLSPGTWVYEQMHSKGINIGIYTITVGDIVAGTIDGYASPSSPNELNSLTGIIVPSAGVYRLKVKMATKNASSSDYFGVLQHIQLRRTD
jgi:hypothetical protein